jgi:hypothetical protein
MPSSSIEPTDLDVLLGRTKQCFNHIGNRSFRAFIKDKVHLYIRAPSRSEKGLVVKSIVDGVVAQGGRFLKLTPDQKHWEDVTDDKIARDKVSHAVRDAATGTIGKKMGRRSIKMLAADVGTSSNENISLLCTARKDRSDKGIRRCPSDDWSNSALCIDDSSEHSSHPQEARILQDSPTSTIPLPSSHFMIELHKHSGCFLPLEDTGRNDCPRGIRVSLDGLESGFFNPDFQTTYDILKQANNVCDQDTEVDFGQQDDGIDSLSWIGDEPSYLPLITEADEVSLFALECRM